MSLAQEATVSCAEELSVARQRVPVRLFALSAGVIITNIFAPQTLVGLMATSAGVTTSQSRLIAMIPFLGYAAGLFFLLPLADLVENRRLVLRMLTVAVISTLGVILVSNAATLFVLLFALGAAWSAIQVLVPIAASMGASMASSSVYSSSVERSAQHSRASCGQRVAGRRFASAVLRWGSSPSSPAGSSKITPRSSVNPSSDQRNP